MNKRSSQLGDDVFGDDDYNNEEDSGWMVTNAFLWKPFCCRNIAAEVGDYLIKTFIQGWTRHPGPCHFFPVFWHWAGLASSASVTVCGLFRQPIYFALNGSSFTLNIISNGCLLSSLVIDTLRHFHNHPVKSFSHAHLGERIKPRTVTAPGIQGETLQWDQRQGPTCPALRLSPHHQSWQNPPGGIKSK